MNGITLYLNNYTAFALLLSLYAILTQTSINEQAETNNEECTEYKFANPVKSLVDISIVFQHYKILRT